MSETRLRSERGREEREGDIKGGKEKGGEREREREGGREGGTCRKRENGIQYTL